MSGPLLLYGLRAVNGGGMHRVVIATHEGVVKSHIIGPASIGSVEALKGKRIGYSGTGAVTHFGLLSLPDEPYPSVAGIQAMMALYDTPAMRQRRAEEFYDGSIVEELDRSGYLDAARR